MQRRHWWNPTCRNSGLQLFVSRHPACPSRISNWWYVKSIANVLQVCILNICTLCVKLLVRLFFRTSVHLYHKTKYTFYSCVAIQPGTDNKISSHLQYYEGKFISINTYIVTVKGIAQRAIDRPSFNIEPLIFYFRF